MSRATREPVGHTCPDIDHVITNIYNTIKELNEVNRYLDSSVLSSCINYLDGLESTMETIRSANDKLRDWGLESNSIIEDLEEEICHLEDKISELT